ncbi:hypothetical protein FB385_2223 [Paramicrobacterium agarici]|nr:hypothetical protein FB385_2223 [Microbacterium agarici]
MVKNETVTVDTEGTRPSRTWNSRELLIIGAFGALGAVVTATASPATAAVALVSPVAYALVAGIHFVLPITAGIMLRSWRAIPLTALFTAALAFPFSTLGLLLFPALALPTLAVGLAVKMTGCRWQSPARWAVAAVVGAVVIYAISLVVIRPDLFSAALLVSVLAARLVSTGLAVVIAHLIVASLARAGVRVH